MAEGGLDFTLRFVAGRGVLGLPPRTLDGWIGLERLELEVPHLRFPFDVAGGAARFQSRRTALAAAELRLDGAQLQRWLDERARLPALGLSELRAHLGRGRLTLAARAQVGDHEAALTARVRLGVRPAPSAQGRLERLAMRLDDVRLYGFLPAPAPLVGLGLLYGLIGARAAAATLAVHGVDEILLDPLELVLWRTLPPAGWRLPRTAETRLRQVIIDEHGVALRWSSDRAAAVNVDVDGAALLGPRAADESAADELLARGAIDEAVAAYARLGRSGESPFAAERHLAVLTSSPGRWPEAETLAARLHAAHPDSVQPLVALAQIEAERGLYATAAARYADLATRAAAAGEVEDARAAALRAGELYAEVAPSEALPHLERALAAHRDDLRTAELLARCYAAEARWADLVRLERWRVTRARDRAEEIAARSRLARLWLDHLGDPSRARDELERLVRGATAGEAEATPLGAEVWELYARALEAANAPLEALAALDRAGALRSDPRERAALHLEAAALAERSGALDAALDHAHRALAATPDDVAALGRAAALYQRLGRLDEAVTSYQRAIDRAADLDDDALRAGLLVELGRLMRDALGDHQGARVHVERALQLLPSPAALALAVELAEHDGRLVDLERLLGAQAEAGDRRARLRQAEVCLDLGRFADAAEAAEELIATEPALALALVARARRALAQPAAERDALERLVALVPDAAPRVRLAELVAGDGDLGRARALLEDAAAAHAGTAVDERALTEAVSDVLLRQGDDEALERALERLVALREEPAARARALAAQGAARVRLGRLADAVDAYRAALPLADAADEAQVRGGLGEAAYALRRWDEARAALEPLHARALPPRVERALRLGEIAERQGDGEAAVDFYRAALAAGAGGADGARAYHALVGLYRGRGDHAAEAEALLAAADDTRLNESDTARAGRLVAAADLLRKRSGHLDQAVDAYERALVLDPLQMAALDALEAIASEAGERERVAQLLSRKVAATARRPAERRAILGRLAALQLELGRPDAARAAYARALELDADFAPALRFLADDARLRGDDDEERAALMRLVALKPDPLEPEALPGDLGRLAQLHAAAGAGEAAERAARAALELHPRERRALAVLDEIYSAAGRAAELASVLARRAEVEGDFELVVELSFRRAALLEELGERAAAVLAYEQLLVLRPTAALAWNRLAALWRAGEEWPKLAAHLERLAEREALEGRRAEAEALYVELAHLAHDRLGDPERAGAELRRALEVQPGSRVALGSLLVLARGRGDAAEEDELLGRLAALGDDPAARAQAVTERARARHARGDDDGALALVRELAPADAPDEALRLLVEIEEARGRLAEAAAALEELRARAAVAGDAAGERYAVRRLLQVARVRHAGAAEGLARRALDLDADDAEAATALAELARARGDAAGERAALEHLLAIERRGLAGPAREAELCLALARAAVAAGDGAAARVRVGEALALAPDEGAALRLHGLLAWEDGERAEATRALERAAAAGALDADAWLVLAAAHEERGDEAGATQALERAGLAAPPRKRAQVARRAGRHAEARAAAVEALTLEPRDPELFTWAGDGLGEPERLALVEELEPRLAAADAAALYAEVAARSSGDTAAHALERAVALCPTPAVLVALARRSAPAEALPLYQEALVQDPTRVDAALGLAALAAPALAAPALATALAATADGDARDRARLAGARAALFAADDAGALGDGAAARAALALAVAASAPFAAESEFATARPGLLRALAARAAVDGDDAAAESALAALLAEGGAGDDDRRHLGALLAARGAHDQAIALLAGVPAAATLVARSLAATRRWAELVALLDGADADLDAEVAAIADAELQRRLGERARARGDAAAEEAALAQAAALGDAGAWPRLTELLRARGDGPRLAAALLGQAESAAGAARAALLREAVPHLDAAAAAAVDEELLVLDPGDGAARARVLARLRQAGDRAALMARLERESEASDDAERAALADELAELAMAADDPVRAQRAWTAALAAQPSLERARALAAVPGAEHADLGPLFERALADERLLAGERTAVAELALRAHLGQGGDPARALAFVEAAAARGLEVALDAATYRGLLRAERRFADLVAALDRAAAAAADPERTALEREAAELTERELGRGGEAARRWAALFDRHPERRDLAARARHAYAAAGEPIYALAILDRELRLMPDGAEGASEAAQLKIVRGELLLEAGADAEAEAEFLQALRTTPRIGRAHAALAEVYKKRGDLAAALEHLIAAADAPDLEPMRAAACAVDAADVLLVEGDGPTAERLYQLAAALDPADRRAVDALARLAAARGDYERQVELLGRAAALTADRRERARLALERARLFQHELGREDEAYRAYKEAVVCDANLRDAAHALGALARARGEWTLAAEQLEREIALSADGGERAGLHRDLARLLEEQLADGAEALRHFEQAAALAGDAAGDGGGGEAPWGDLVRLYAEHERWRDAALAAERLAAALPAGRALDKAHALERSAGLYLRAGDGDAAARRRAEAEAQLAEAARSSDEALFADDGDDAALAERVRARLGALSPTEAAGGLHLQLLRRQLGLAVRTGDHATADRAAQEVLARAPDDSAAFIERRRLLAARRDWLGVVQLLRTRAAAVADAAERAERRFEAGRIAEAELYDVTAAAADYEAALHALPEHRAALDALADLAYRTRHLARARHLYAQIGERTSSLGADEVWRRRAELAEEAGDPDEARIFYGYAVHHNPSNLTAHQALARLALATADDPAAYAALRAILELLPLDAVDRITDLRRHLGELAFRLGERDMARHYFEMVLSQVPTDRRALEALVRAYREQQAWPEVAEALGRLSRLVHKPEERAELLYQRGEALRLGLGDLDGANDSYLKAADLHPGHAPTLRRLVAYYYAEGDLGALRDVARDLEQLGQPFEEAALEAGLGIALAGDEARGTVVTAVARPTATRLAEVLALARPRELGALDPALRASARALGAGVGRAALGAALDERLGRAPGDQGARLALARLCDLGGEAERARVHYAVHAFVDGAGLGAARLRDLGPPVPFALPARAVHARGPLAEALAALAPHLVGLPVAHTGEPAPTWSDKLRPVLAAALGGAFDIDAVVALGASQLGDGDPAWLEPTRPLRLLLARRLLTDEAVARFAAARAAHALAAGLPLVDGRSADDVAALIRAAAALFLPDLRAPERPSAFVAAWQTELTALALDPEALDEPARARLEVVLAAALVDSGLVEAAREQARWARHDADRAAFATTGDLRAGLLALCPPDAGDTRARAAALASSAALAELIAFALSRT